MILLEGWFDTPGVEVVVGVEVIVAEEMEQSAVKGVRARPKADVYGASQTAAEFRGKQITLDLEFGNRIGTWQDGRLVVIGRIVVNSVEQEIVILNPVAVDSDEKVLVQGVIPLRNIGAGREGD